MDRRAVALVAVLASAAFGGRPAQAGAPPFADVPANHWAAPAIASLAADGVIDGYPDGSFKGDRPLTRYEMAAIVARAIAKPEANATGTASTTDLAALRELIVALADELDALGRRMTNLARRLGSPSGVLDERATPRAGLTGRANAAPASTAAGAVAALPGDRPLTRYETAAIVAHVIAQIDANAAAAASQTDLETLHRFVDALKDELDALGVRMNRLEEAVPSRAGRPPLTPILAVAVAGPAGTAPFADVPATGWAERAVAGLATVGIIAGYPDGSFKGERPLTRHELAAIVARVLASGSTAPSKRDLEQLQKLTAGPTAQLNALGVRMTQLEDAVAARERRRISSPPPVRV